jgi:hypothetical protein
MRRAPLFVQDGNNYRPDSPAGWAALGGFLLLEAFAIAFSIWKTQSGANVAWVLLPVLLPIVLGPIFVAIVVTNARDVSMTPARAASPAPPSSRT